MILLLGFSTGGAQDHYTYVSDRKFSDPVDLVGYNFCPSAMEIRGQVEEEVEPGTYSFGITPSNLYVNGPEIKGVYSLNNINTTDYGFKMLLMNARDPTIQGHLKVILNSVDQVEALIFKRSTQEPEVIFYQAAIPKGLSEREGVYFTDLLDLEISHPDSLWGQKIYPFLKIHHDAGTQERLVPSDSTSIEFIERITVIEKIKKKKKKKKKEEALVDNIEVGTSQEDLEESAAEEEAVEVEEAVALPQTDLVEDEGAMPPGTEADVAAAQAALEETEGIVKDIKIVKEYFVVVRSILSYEDGSVEDKIWEFPVKKVTEREDALAGPMEERYQLEISLLKGDPLYLYLTSKRTVSSFEMGPKQFLMRGH